MFSSFNWLQEFLHKEAAEESQLAKEHVEANIVDAKADGNKVQAAALDLYGTEDGALLELTWHPSSYKLFSKQYPSIQDAQNMFNQVKGNMLQISKMVLEGAQEEAESASTALLQSLANISTEPLNQTTNQPVTQTQAAAKSWSCTQCPFTTRDPKAGRAHSSSENPETGGHVMTEDKEASLQVTILIPALSKEAKATVQNIFFSDVNELLQWQSAQKAAQPTSSPNSLPGGTPGGTPNGAALPPMPDPNAKGPLMNTPASPSALEKMVDQRVQEKVESSLDAKARAIFEDVHAETVKVLRQLGRSWEEIKDFFNRYLKYDWDDIDVYLDQFIQAEQGTEDPGTERVKDEMAVGEEGAPPELGNTKPKPEVLPKPEILPAASQLPKIEKAGGYPEALGWATQSLKAVQAELKIFLELLAQDDKDRVIQRLSELNGTISTDLDEIETRKNKKMAELTKSAELVRFPDALKKGDQVTLVRSIMTKENTILKPEVTGRIVQANEYSIVIESSEGTFTISKHDCSKLDKKASRLPAFDPDVCECGSANLEGGPDCVCGKAQDQCGDCHKTLPHSGLCDKVATSDALPKDHYEGHCPECASGDHFDDGSETDCRCPVGCHLEIMEVDAALDITGEKYYLDPNAQYDWETDLIDEISGRLGEYQKSWKFTAGDKWEIQGDGSDKPYVEVTILGNSSSQRAVVDHDRAPMDWAKEKHRQTSVQPHGGTTYLWQKQPKAHLQEGSTVVHSTLGSVLVHAISDLVKVEDQEGNFHLVQAEKLDFGPLYKLDEKEQEEHERTMKLVHPKSPAPKAIASLEVEARGERQKIRDLKDQLVKAKKPADIKALCDAIDALEGRQDKEKERKTQRKEEKAKKVDTSPKQESNTSITATAAVLLRREPYGEAGRGYTRGVYQCACGKEVLCATPTNTCECGADYNMSGQRLAPREQWGEETGESASDILNYDYEQGPDIEASVGDVKKK